MRLTERLRRSKNSEGPEKINVENIHLTLVCDEYEPRKKGIRMVFEEKHRAIEVFLDDKTYTEFARIVNDVKVQMDLVG